MQFRKLQSLTKTRMNANYYCMQKKGGDAIICMCICVTTEIFPFLEWTKRANQKYHGNWKNIFICLECMMIIKFQSLSFSHGSIHEDITSKIAISSSLV